MTFELFLGSWKKCENRPAFWILLLPSLFAFSSCWLVLCGWVDAIGWIPDAMALNGWNGCERMKKWNGWTVLFMSERAWGRDSRTGNWIRAVIVVKPLVQFSLIISFFDIDMGLFGRKKEAKPAVMPVDPDEEKTRKMIEVASSIDEKIEMSDKKYCLT